MLVRFVETLDASVPTAFIVTDTSLAASQVLLPEGLSQQGSAQVGTTASDEWTTYQTPQAHHWMIGVGPSAELTAERLRKAVHKLVGRANEAKHASIQIVLVGLIESHESLGWVRALADAAVLSNYQFLEYRKDPEKLANALATVSIYTDVAEAAAAIDAAVAIAEATCLARDLVNEPPNVLTAVELAERARVLGQTHGFAVEIFNKKKIEELGMGGLLAVNRGSQTPPTFSILEWKPEDAKNTQPIVLVGKGITFDTGGLSLKPTAGSMDSMKSDMAGSAAVIGAFVAAARNRLPVHLIGLIPSTDNRPGEDAYTPNDVIRHLDGTTVEVLNTDAEGRLILADALVYAKRYSPELVIDLATLTGAAVVAVGTIGIALMSTASDDVKQRFARAGNYTYERVIELPLWAEYREQLKSEIADMKNIGGRYAGAITAGKFLEHFTDYPWVHLDIAGPAFLDSGDSYRGKQGTGVGVRLLSEFLESYTR